MGNPKGFIEVKRKESGNRPVEERINDFSEVEQTLNTDDRMLQASRCMDCGIPFCSWACPIFNNMPEWQDAIYQGRWAEASDILHTTNNFPEFTGRVCPAPCEHGCVLNIHREPVTIRENEAAVAERAFAEGHIVPRPPLRRTGKRVAVVGSGPAGLACADLLNQAGHSVVLFEKDEAVGGLLRFGIPDFKLSKKVIDRRVAILLQEGLEIRTNTLVGRDVPAHQLVGEFDAVCLAIGAAQPRDLPIEGRHLRGIHLAMEYLAQQNRVVSGASIPQRQRITAAGREVIVIGGGDTGSDCVGTAIRQRARQVTQIEIMPQPPGERTPDNPWPYWAHLLKTSSSQEEGCTRHWSLATKRFIGQEGHLRAIEVVDVEWAKGNGRPAMVERPETLRQIPADLVLLSLGFLHCVHPGLVTDLALALDPQGNLLVNTRKQTSLPKVFAAGDATRGPSLVVHAIHQGRTMAHSVDHYLREGA